MNEREVQAFLSGLPKHVPQRMAKFRAGQIISDSMHGLSGVVFLLFSTLIVVSSLR